MKSELLDKNTIKKILVIRNDNIGDLICTTPMLQSLKKRFRDASISVLVNKYNKEIIENNDIIDDYFVYDKLKHGRHKSRLGAWFELLKLIFEIRKKEFDLVVSARSSYSPSVARMAYFSGARWRLGYVPLKGIIPLLFYNIPVVSDNRRCHEVDKTYRLVAPIGINKENEEPVVNIPELEKKKAEDYLKENGIKRKNYLVAIHISSRRPENRWPIDRFIKIINFLTRKGIKVVVLWMPGDESNPMHPGDDRKAESIKEKVDSEIILYKTISVKELIGVLSLCKLVVCLDGGAMHLASALKIPVISIFGSTDPNTWGPYGKGHTVLKKGNDIKDIKVKEVIEVINYNLPRKYMKLEDK